MHGPVEDRAGVGHQDGVPEADGQVVRDGVVPNALAEPGHHLQLGDPAVVVCVEAVDELLQLRLPEVQLQVPHGLGQLLAVDDAAAVAVDGVEEGGGVGDLLAEERPGPALQDLVHALGDLDDLHGAARDPDVDPRGHLLL